MPQTPKSDDTTDPIATLQQAQADGMAVMTSLGAAMADNMRKFGTEMTAFVGERFKEDVKTQHALVTCRRLDDLAEIQADFMKTAFDQYSAEAGKMTELGADLFEKATKPLKNA